MITHMFLWTFKATTVEVNMISCEIGARQSDTEWAVISRHIFVQAIQADNRQCSAWLWFWSLFLFLMKLIDIWPGQVYRWENLCLQSNIHSRRQTAPFPCQYFTQFRAAPSAEHLNNCGNDIVNELQICIEITLKMNAINVSLAFWVLKTNNFQG